MAFRVNENDINRFRGKQQPPNENGCRLWDAGLATGGYGQFKVNGRARMAHIVAWVIEHGDVPPGLCVLHKCDVRRCTEVTHLFLGTKADNSADMVAKNRQAKGGKTGRHTMPERTARGDNHGMRLHPDRVPRAEKNGMAKLSWDKVREIRHRYSTEAISQTALALDFQIDQTTVSGIVRNKTWRE